MTPDPCSMEDTCKVVSSTMHKERTGLACMETYLEDSKTFSVKLHDQSSRYIFVPNAITHAWYGEGFWVYLLGGYKTISCQSSYSRKLATH